MRAYIVESKMRGTWQLRYWENGVRKQKQVGTVRDWSTKAEAEKANEHSQPVQQSCDRSSNGSNCGRALSV
jgi:hypothetical protein